MCVGLVSAVRRRRPARCCRLAPVHSAMAQAATLHRSLQSGVQCIALRSCIECVVCWCLITCLARNPVLRSHTPCRADTTEIMIKSKHRRARDCTACTCRDDETRLADSRLYRSLSKEGEDGQTGERPCRERSAVRARSSKLNDVRY